MSRVLARILKPLRLGVLEPHGTTSFSQEGEDMVLRRVFERRGPGFYVDVGAHHPRRFSNTYHFYLRGWSGLNVDAMPGSMRLFERLRPRDINVEAAIAAERKELTYYAFNDPALNTLDEALARSRVGPEYRIVATHKVVARPLREILAERLPAGTRIAFMSIDAEGYDLEVARSNDWAAYRPECLLVESYGETLEDALAGDLSRFVASQGYRAFARTGYTLFFRDASGPRP